MNETDIHNKDFALSLALKWRLRRTRKWPIEGKLNKDLFHPLILTQLPIGVVAPYWKAANVLKRDTLARLKI